MAQGQFGWDKDVFTLLFAQTTTATGGAFPLVHPAAFQATVTGTGAVASTVDIQVSNDSTNWFTLATITLTDTTTDTDGAATSAPFAYIRAKITAISGTSATVTVIMSRAL